MARFGDLFGASRTWTVAANVLADADGLKTSFSGALTATTVTGTPAANGDWNGALAAAFLAGQTPARTISITTSTQSGSYKVGAANAIVITGTRGGVTVTESVLLVHTNGNETIRGHQPFDGGHVLTVVIPGQNDALGAFTIGLQDIYAPAFGDGIFRGIKCNAAGDVLFEYPVQDAQATPAYVLDKVPYIAGEFNPIECQAIRAYDNSGGAGTTAGLTVFY